MGMYDNVDCEYALPDTDIKTQLVGFQTKSLNRKLDNYKITQDGKLLFDDGKYSEEQNKFINNWKPYIFDCNINFYTFGPKDSNESGWYEYNAEFRDGSLINIQRKK